MVRVNNSAREDRTSAGSFSAAVVQLVDLFRSDTPAPNAERIDASLLVFALAPQQQECRWKWLPHLTEPPPKCRRGKPAGPAFCLRHCCPRAENRGDGARAKANRYSRRWRLHAPIAPCAHRNRKGYLFEIVCDHRDPSRDQIIRKWAGSRTLNEVELQDSNGRHRAAVMSNIRWIWLGGTRSNL